MYTADEKYVGSTEVSDRSHLLNLLFVQTVFYIIEKKNEGRCAILWAAPLGVLILKQGETNKQETQLFFSLQYKITCNNLNKSSIRISSKTFG